MSKIERIREEMPAPPAADYWKRKADAGWRLAAVEWTRELPGTTTVPMDPAEEIPYGLKISDELEEYITRFLVRYFRRAISVVLLRADIEAAQDLHLLRLHWTISQAVQRLITHLRKCPHELQATLESRARQDDACVRGRLDARERRVVVVHCGGDRDVASRANGLGGQGHRERCHVVNIADGVLRVVAREERHIALWSPLTADREKAGTGV